MTDLLVLRRRGGRPPLKVRVVRARSARRRRVAARLGALGWATWRIARALGASRRVVEIWTGRGG
ncbi:hypothetical protein [Oharaeibacter diazotrophicus]|nr:hypothetical protein [Oharaeibacter diazotrophicus]